jgi:Xaa-Pro aminopeptidase
MEHHMNPVRIEKLGKEIQSQGWDCLALVPGANLFYITGLPLRLSDRPTVAFFRPGGPPALVLPHLEAGNAAGMPDVQLFLWSDEKGYRDAFQRACAALDLAGSQIGVEAFTMRVVEARLSERSAPGSRIIPADGVISALRMHKDAAELDRMRRAA